MTKHLLLPLLLAAAQLSAQTVFQGNTASSYEEVMTAYRGLNEEFPKDTRLWKAGKTDSGEPLHLFVIGKNLPQHLGGLRPDERPVWLILNGIHPGEACGIEASILYARELLKEDPRWLKKVIIAVVPVYNIGGSRVRSCCHRANQDGPEMQGFRGNARLLDLNRDLIKLDAENSRSLVDVFHRLQPDLFLDTHTSDGADYPYSMTLISTQKDKLGPLSNFQKQFDQALYTGMEKAGTPMIPYVNLFGKDPAGGWDAFLESPRYTTGYAATQQILGYVSEAHMLHSFEERVNATLQLLRVMGQALHDLGKDLKEARKQALVISRQSETVALDWEVDKTTATTLNVNLYPARMDTSVLSGSTYMRFDRGDTLQAEIKYYEHYRPTLEVTPPAYYILPQGWKEVTDRLVLNRITFTPLARDTVMQVRSYRLEHFKTDPVPYEGHFYWKEISGRWVEEERLFFKGDLLIPASQGQRRLLTEVLEPEAPDSYLRWNFFDEIFQQKEWMSDYLFEETALRLLEEDPALREEFELWKAGLENPGKWEVLTWIYRRSPYYEVSHLRYPVARVE